MFNKKQHQPIQEFEEDCLNLKNYINGLCAYINQNFEYNNNACIGIIGKWGDGKTSAINLCIKNLLKQNKLNEKFDYKSLIFTILIIIVLVLLLGFNFKYLIFGSKFVYTKILKYLGSNQNLILLILLILVMPFKYYQYFISKIKVVTTKIFRYLFIKNQIIVIHFTPWDCSNKEQMFKEYLKLLSNELFLVIPSISAKLLKYAKIISGINLNNILEELIPNLDITTLKQEITESLRQTDKKIIVVIDDFDRIQSDEIFNLLKLVGTIANFPNIINVVAYDKKYVCDNLNLYFSNDNENINNSEKYIQKIIPYEFPLPQISHITLYKIFINELEKIIESDKYNKEYLEANYVNTIGEYICNIRDLKQLLVGFEFHYNIFKNQGVKININDLLFITSIKIFNFDLWQNLYECGKTHLTYQIGYPTWLTNEFQVKEFFDKFLSFGKLSQNELNILGSLIPRITEISDYKFYLTNNHDCYDIKRLWSTIDSFNLYFEYNPPVSHITDILNSLSDKSFNYNNFLSLLNTDVDWSDLQDIIYSHQYNPHLSNTTVLNFINFILRYEDSHKKFRFREFRYGRPNIFEKISNEEFTSKVNYIIANNSKLNINGLVELLYVFFLYQENLTTVMDIKTLSDIELQMFNSILPKFKELLNQTDITELSTLSMYYLCLGYGKIDDEITKIIQQKIYNDIEHYDNYQLLDYLKHFFFKSNEVMYSLEILKEDNIFTIECKDLLKKKLLVLKENIEIMQNSEYKFIFTEQNHLGRANGYKSCHIVEFILNLYLKDI